MNESIRECPKNTEALYDLAKLRAQDPDGLPQALELIDRALMYNPGRSLYLEFKADVLSAMGDAAAALEILRELSTKYPEDLEIEEKLLWLTELQQDGS